MKNPVPDVQAHRKPKRRRADDTYPKRHRRTLHIFCTAYPELSRPHTSYRVFSYVRASIRPLHQAMHGRQ